MSNINFITWEQATKLDVVKPIAEKYQEQLQDVLLFFVKNTHAQLFAMELYMDAMELYEVYKNKDYSKYLFDKTEEIFKRIETAKQDLEPLKEKLIAFAKINSELKFNK